MRYWYLPQEDKHPFIFFYRGEVEPVERKVWHYSNDGRHVWSNWVDLDLVKESGRIFNKKNLVEISEAEFLMMKFELA